jgi:hypothetical protein
LLLSSIIALLGSFKNEEEQMTENTLYWLFSTIAQTYGAVLGVFGMLTVYRLQTLSNDTENCRKRAEVPARVVFGVEAYGLSPEDLAEKWQKFPGKEQMGHQGQIMNREMERIKRYNRWSKKIRKWLGAFIVSHGIIIILAILGIMFIEQVVPLGSIIVYIFVGLLVASVISIGLLIWYLYSDKSPIHNIRSVLQRS